MSHNRLACLPLRSSRLSCDDALVYAAMRAMSAGARVGLVLELTELDLIRLCPWRARLPVIGRRWRRRAARRLVQRAILRLGDLS